MLDQDSIRLEHGGAEETAAAWVIVTAAGDGRGIVGPDAPLAHDVVRVVEAGHDRAEEADRAGLDAAARWREREELSRELRH